MSEDIHGGITEINGNSSSDPLPNIPKNDSQSTPSDPVSTESQTLQPTPKNNAAPVESTTTQPSQQANTPQGNLNNVQPTPSNQQPQQQPQTGGNGIAVAGLVIACIGIVFFWFPFLGQILWLVGLILSVIGLFKQPRGAAIAGVVVSIVVVIVYVLFVFTLFSIGKGMVDNTLDAAQEEGVDEILEGFLDILKNINIE